MASEQVVCACHVIAVHVPVHCARQPTTGAGVRHFETFFYANQYVIVAEGG